MLCNLVAYLVLLRQKKNIYNRERYVNSKADTFCGPDFVRLRDLRLTVLRKRGRGCVNQL